MVIIPVDTRIGNVSDSAFNLDQVLKSSLKPSFFPAESSAPECNITDGLLSE